MQKKLKVLIGDPTRSLGMFCQNLLQKSGIETVLTPRDGVEVLKAIREENPDVVVLEALMSQLNAAEVIRALNRISPRPKVIVIGGGDHPDLENELMQAGASCYMLKPFDNEVFCEQIQALGGLGTVDFARKEDEVDPESMVTDVMLHIGIPANVKGYSYIREAILLAIDDSSLIGAMTKRLYPTTAETFDSTPSRVERAIRHAIELAWDRGDVDVLNSYFGFTVNTGRGKPTSSEFIAMIADRIRLKLKKLRKDRVGL